MHKKNEAGPLVATNILGPRPWSNEYLEFGKDLLKTKGGRAHTI